MEKQRVETDFIITEPNGGSVSTDTPEAVTPQSVAASELPQSDKETEPVATGGEEMSLPSEGKEGDICVRLAAIELELGRTNRLFEEKIFYDTAKEDIISRMHKEIQVYKDDMFKKMLKPIFMDMIAFADSMKALVSHYEETPEREALLDRYQRLRKEFSKVGEHIDDVLYNYGIEPYGSKSGDEFNPRTQQAKKNTPTENPNEHRKIVGSMLAGYTWDDQLLRRESVHISTREQQAQNETNHN